MKFKSKISGIWYGIPLTAEREINVPDHLVNKAAAQPENFEPVSKTSEAVREEVVQSLVDQGAIEDPEAEPEEEEKAEEPRKRGRPRKQSK